MKNVFLILGVIALSISVYFVTHCHVTQEARLAMESEYPELEWLKREFSLSEEQFKRIKSLHSAHDEDCQFYCSELVASREQLRIAIQSESLDSQALQASLENWRDQKKRSLDAVIKHMYEVSSIMDEENGRRYRDHIYRTLILPSRTPHIDEDGNFKQEYIEHPRR